MPDYQGNSKKSKGEDQPEKKIERVTTGEVLIQKKGLGTKFKEFFIATDVRSVFTYVVWDVFLPAFKNMVVDGASRGVERMMFGERAVTRGYRANHVTYQSPVRRGYSAMGSMTPDNLDRRGLPPGRQEQYARTALNSGLFILSTKEEAEAALEQMNNVIEQYEAVTVADLCRMIGYPSTHVDVTFGWVDIRTARVEQIREGYLLDLPQPQPLR